MKANLLHKSMHEVVQAYKDNDYRFVTMTHTLDGMDRTWQSSGAGYSEIDHHADAMRMLGVLKDRIALAGLPPEWLLQQIIEVSSYDRETRRERTSKWTVVYVPRKAKTPMKDKKYENCWSGVGFHVVSGIEGMCIHPITKPLDA